MQQIPGQPNKQTPNQSNQPPKEPLNKESEILIQPETPKEPIAPEPLKEAPIAEPKPVTPEPVTKPTTPEPVVKPVAPEPKEKAPITEPIAPKPVTEPVIPEPVVKPVAPEPKEKAPIAEPVAPKPVTEPVIPEPVVKPIAPKPIPEPKKETPITEPVAPEPKKETPITEPVAPEPKKEVSIVEPVKPEPIPEPKKEVSVKSPVVEKPTTPEQPVAKVIPHTPVSKEVKSEKLDLLKHMDVRTMEKDVAVLRKNESIKEKERIYSLTSKKVTKTEDEVIADSLISGNHEKTREIKIPRAPSRFDKIFVRALVIFFLVFIIANIVGFGYYYFFVADRTTDSLEPTPEEQIQPPAFIAPDSLFTVNRVVQTPFTQKESIPLILSAILKTEREDGFTRIILTDSQNNTAIQLPEFFEAFNVVPPTEILDLLEDDFTLFVYANEGRERLGLVIQGKEGIADIAINWEASLETDTQELFNIIGEKGQGYVASFRTATINGQTTARFQTLSLNDLGIVYGIIDNKLILTSSLQSFEDIIQELK